MAALARLLAMSLSLLGVVAVHAAIAEAGASPFWKELGGSAHGDGLSAGAASASSASVALGSDGQPVVAYIVEHSPSVFGPGFGSIVVKRWTGEAWEALGDPDGIAVGFGPQIRIAPSGTAYVAWFAFEQPSGQGQVHLLRWRPAAMMWESIDGSDGPGGLTSLGLPDADGGTGPFSLAVGGDGLPIVAFETAARTGINPPLPGIRHLSNQVYVKRYDAALGWQYVGTDPFTGGGASNVSSFRSTAGYLSHDVDTSTLAVDASGAPVVAFGYAEFLSIFNRDIFVTRWNGSAWTAVGPVVPEADDGAAARRLPGGVSATGGISRSPALGASPSGDLWLAWFEIPGGSDDTYVLVRRWNGAAWEDIGRSGSGTGISAPGFFNSPPSVGIDGDGAAIVTWYAQPHEINPSQIVVKRAGTAFVEMGTGAAGADGISASVLGAFFPIVATAPGSAPAVVWQDFKDFDLPTGQIFLRQFSAAPLTVGVSGRGRVVSAPAGIVCPDGSCRESFATGQVVTLTPVAGAEAIFDRWTGACSGSGPCRVTLSAPRTVNASFVAAATLSIAKSGNGADLGVVNGPRIACGADCQETYKAGTTVTLTVALPTGTLFNGWGGDCAVRSRNTSCTLIMSANRSVNATFSRRVYHMTVRAAVAPGTAGRDTVGRVTVAGVADPRECLVGDAAPCVFDVVHGSGVAVFATAEAGNRFVRWTGTPCVFGPLDTACDFKVGGDIVVTGLFRGVTSVNVVKTGKGQGTITGPGIACGADCDGEAFTNTSATLRFAPATGTLFRQWEGGPCDGVRSPACTIFARDDVTITARSELRRHRLIVTPRTNGSVVSTTALADSIDCGAACVSTLDYGTIVGLRASADPGFVFTRWTGNAPCSAGARATNASCVFALQANVTATPNFRPATPVTLTKTGDGVGTVTMSGTLSAGVICGPTCAGATVQAFDGRLVTLRATPSVGSTFTGFSGACATNASVCSFVPAGAQQNVSAGFVLQPRTVSVVVRGDGVVTGPSPCAAEASPCTFTGLFGGELVLTAAPGMGNRLISWTGCTGVATGMCRVRLTSAGVNTVTATFSFSLGVLRIGGGTVTGPGINCGVDCAGTYAPGGVVTLSRLAAAGTRFNGWGDDCAAAAQNSTCRLTMSANRVVSASFDGVGVVTPPR